MVSITEYAYELGEEHIVGTSEIIKRARFDNARLLSDMILECSKKIIKKPDIIYVAHSLPFAKGTEGVELEDCFETPLVWISGIPCAITHMALKIAVSQIEAGIYQRILIFGADKAYSDRERSFFNTIMSDAVIGIMLEKGEGIHEYIGSRIDTFLIAAKGENTDPQLVQKYRDFLPMQLRDAYYHCLEQCGMEKVDYIAPHTSARGIWDVFANMIHMKREKILDENIVNTGHMNSNDSFYHYFTHCENGTIQKQNTAMMINPGFGGTRGLTILKRRG